MVNSGRCVDVMFGFETSEVRVGDFSPAKAAFATSPCVCVCVHARTF